MAVQKVVAEKWKAVTGCTLVEAYGLTETSPGACINPMDATGFSGKIGLPFPSTDISVRDDDEVSGVQISVADTVLRQILG